MKKIIFAVLSIILVLTFSINCSADGVYTSAAASVVICADTKEVIFKKNSDQKLPMASTTKIMTALLMAEQPDLSKTAVMTKQMVTVEGSSMGLMEGDTVSYHDLLYGMLLASGNDAANATAILLGGSVKGFVKLMNQKAKTLGLKNTSFATPSGLDDANHYTTAYDLACLAAEALKNPVFAAACSNKSATLYYGNPPYKRTLKNHNRMLINYEGAIGVKTGFTKKSGRCLVSAAKRGGVTVIAVTLNDPDDWKDHENLLNAGFKETKSVRFENDDIPDSIPVICGDCDSVRLLCNASEFSISKGGESVLTRKVFLPKFVYSQISAGECVGKVCHYINDRMIDSTDIISAADVNYRNIKPPFLKRFTDGFLCVLKLI